MTQQQYVATRQYTINAVGQRKKVTAVNRLRCHTLHYPDIYKHPHTHMIWHFLCMYTYTHEVVAFIHVIKSLKHIRTQTCQHIKTLGPSGAYMRHWDKPSMVQIKTSRLISAKQLSKPILTNRQLDFWEQISMKFESKCNKFRPWGEI